MIADPDVHNEDVSKRYTHDTIRPLSYYGGEKKVDLVSAKVTKIVSQMLKTLRKNKEMLSSKLL